MDDTTRSEIEKLHGRVNDLKERVVTLETERPHIKEALARIEGSVKQINAHLTKVVWIVLGVCIVALLKIIVGGHVNFPGV